MKLTILIFLFSTKIFAQAEGDTLPRVTFKYNPVPLFLEVDRHLQFSAEYFINNKSSAQLTFGLGNKKFFKKADYEAVYTIRAEYRRFFKPYSLQKNARNYWATEMMYKYVNEPFFPNTRHGSNLPPFKSNFFVNVLATHFKIGREYIDLKYFPTFDMFFGLGVRAYYNYLGSFPVNYDGSFPSPGMFGRTPGKGLMPSVVVGIGIGIGKWE
jgi:hypothetical protein